MSFWTSVTSAAYRIPTIDRNTTHGTALAVPSGSSGSEKRMKPYVPIFSRTPARITEPAVGASTWASGSQVWNGNIGTLIAKPRKNARNTQSWRLGGMPIWYQSVTSQVPVWAIAGLMASSAGLVFEWK